MDIGNLKDYYNIAILVGALPLFWILYKSSDWIGAKADEAKERARKLELENDMFALELAEKKKAAANK